MLSLALVILILLKIGTECGVPSVTLTAWAVTGPDLLPRALNKLQLGFPPFLGQNAQFHVLSLGSLWAVSEASPPTHRHRHTLCSAEQQSMLCTHWHTGASLQCPVLEFGQEQRMVLDN